MPSNCVIVGAGPAGLAAARWLKTRGIEPTVLEAEAEVGGRTRTLKVNRVLVNNGASFFATFYSETIKLADEIGLKLVPPLLLPGRDGLAHQLSTPQGLLPHRLGTLKGLFHFPMMSFSAKIRALSALSSLVIGKKIHIADTELMAHVDYESAERWGRRRFGDEGYEYLVRVALEPYFYFGADQSSAGFTRALLRHAVRWRPLIPSGGVGMFCSHLAQGLDVHCVAPVREIRRERNGFVVKHDAGEVRGDTVILATPADKTLAIDAPLRPEDREDLSLVRYIPCVRAVLGYKREHAPQIPYITPAGPGKHALMSLSTLSSWEAGRVPEGDEVVWISASGWRSVELADKQSDEIIDALRRDCASIGISIPTPAWSEVIINRQGMVLPETGHFRRMAAFLSRERLGIFFAGDWLTGSTVEGAIRSGQEAAKAVWRQHQIQRHIGSNK